MRLLVVAGDPGTVADQLPGLADHLSAPPAAYAHLPIGTAGNTASLLSLAPANIRLLACKQSWDGEALIVRLQEAAGRGTRARLTVAASGVAAHGDEPDRPGAVAGAANEAVRGHVPELEKRGHVPSVHVPLVFKPFEIKTLRVEKDGRHSLVPMIEEKLP